ncbi:MAG: hypothetical protein IJC56_09990 [Clostridia bacterium]|nr:hypothetical protein [Clostridia bacterium]
MIIALCLLIPYAALAENGDLPDLYAFADGLLWIDPDDETEELDYMVERMYRGTDEDVLHVVGEYITLLTEQYDLKEICHFPISDQDDDTIRVIWAFEYTKNTPEMGSNFYRNDEEGWAIRGYQVLIEYSQSDYYTNEYIKIKYRPEFNYTDTGERVSVRSVADISVPDNTPAASKVICSYCGGDGKCDDCGGDMWTTGWEWEYVNGSPVSNMVTKLCDGIYCYGGSCLMCDGTGYE